MPVAGVDYPRTFQQFTTWFHSDEACREYLARLRWPNGFVCPACGVGEFWMTSAGLWMCRSCQRRTSVTAGTIMHRSRLPLTTWFAAVWFVTSQKNGVSALGLQRVLGIGSYETAWAWMHKLRRAMVRPDRELLSGVVEVDERGCLMVCVSGPGLLSEGRTHCEYDQGRSGARRAHPATERHRGFAEGIGRAR